MDNPVKASVRNAVITIASWHQFAAGKKVRQPRVESRMVLWCKQGLGRVEVNGTSHSLKAGDYVVMPWPHAVTYVPDATTPFLVGGVHIITNHHRDHTVQFDVAHDRSSPLANCPWREDVALPGLENVLVGALSAHPGLHHLLEYVVWRFSRQRQTDASEMRTLASLLVAEMRRSCELEVATEEQGPPQMRRVMLWIRDHIDQRPSLDELATLASCSPSTLQRQFKNHLQLTPLQWVTRVKLEKASELMRSNTLSIAQVGQHIGIDDPFYFSRWFRQLTHESPREFRRRMCHL